MAWNNVYLDATPGAVFTGSASTVPLTTSGVSIQGRLSVGSNISVSGSFSATSATYTGAVSIGGGFPLSLVTRGRQLVTNLTATATKSTETTWANNLVAVGDVIIGSILSTSALSAGLTPYMYASAASTVALRLSNCSTANASTDSATWQYWVFR